MLVTMSEIELIVPDERKGGVTMSTGMGHIPAAIPANWVPGPPQGQWTYQDYAALPEDGNRYEVLQGVLYMAP
jgi:hypothetical protein